MIRFLFRFLGFLILAGGFIALVYDGTKSIAGSAFVYTPLGQIWTNIHSKSLQLLQPAIDLVPSRTSATKPAARIQRPVKRKRKRIMDALLSPGCASGHPD